MHEALRIWRLCKSCATRIYGRTQPSARYAENVAQLLFGTAAQESGLRWERQRTPRWDGEVGGFSKWQLERDAVTAGLIYLSRRPDVLRRTTEFIFEDSRAPLDWIQQISLTSVLWAMRMDDNDKIGVAFCRLYYFRIPQPIPHTLEEQACYWKAWYNTAAGAGTPEQYLRNWCRYCQPVIEAEAS